MLTLVQMSGLKAGHPWLRGPSWQRATRAHARHFTPIGVRSLPRVVSLTSALCALVLLVGCGKTTDGGAAGGLGGADASNRDGSSGASNASGADPADSGTDAEPSPDSGVGRVACEAQDCSIASELCCEVLAPSEDSAGLESATCQADCPMDAGARMQVLALGCDQAQDCGDGEHCCLDGTGSACRAQCAVGEEVACYEVNVRGDSPCQTPGCLSVPGNAPCQTPGCSRKAAVPGCWRTN